MSTAAVIFDAHELIDELDKLGVTAQNVPLSIISDALISEIDDEIQSEGRGRWPGFSDTTIRLHPRRSNGKLLQDTGLLASLQATEGPDWVKVKSPAKYAGFHVTGAFQRNIYKILAPHVLPKRNFLDIDLPRVLEESAQAIADEIAHE